jgi:hypothetical protein
MLNKRLVVGKATERLVFIYQSGEISLMAK